MKGLSILRISGSLLKAFSAVKLDIKCLDFISFSINFIILFSRVKPLDLKIYTN